jgi:hypothetical protein
MAKSLHHMVKGDELGEVCILFSDCLGASSVSQSVDGRRGVRVCPEASGASRWWEFVGSRVGVPTNVGGSVFIVESHDQGSQ